MLIMIARATGYRSRTRLTDGLHVLYEYVRYSSSCRRSSTKTDTSVGRFDGSLPFGLEHRPRIAKEGHRDGKGTLDRRREWISARLPVTPCTSVNGTGRGTKKHEEQSFAGATERIQTHPV
jgi:hypothetical protein